MAMFGVRALYSVEMDTYFTRKRLSIYCVLWSFKIYAAEMYCKSSDSVFVR
jgi:hypothetical protein